MSGWDFLVVEGTEVFILALFIFFLDKKNETKKIKTLYKIGIFLNLLFLLAQSKLVHQENLRLVPRQGFLRLTQAGLLPPSPPSKTKLRTVPIFYKIILSRNIFLSIEGNGFAFFIDLILKGKLFFNFKNERCHLLYGLSLFEFDFPKKNTALIFFATLFSSRKKK
jgi:hypothetical protein